MVVGISREIFLTPKIQLETNSLPDPMAQTTAIVRIGHSEASIECGAEGPHLEGREDMAG